MEEHTDTLDSVVSSPSERQFDFWLGEWNLTWADGGEGTNTIQAILNDKVILESFDASPTGTFRGMSVSVYDAVLARWQQTWVDNLGNYLDFVGGFANGKMTLERVVRPAGTTVIQRMVFYNISETELDWNWEQSVDQGATWELLWHIHYQRKS